MGRFYFLEFLLRPKYQVTAIKITVRIKLKISYGDMGIEITVMASPPLEWGKGSAKIHTARRYAWTL